MEEIIFKYIQEQYSNQQNIIKENIKALEDKEQLLQIKDKEIKEKEEIINNFRPSTYEEAEKVGFIYLLSTDKQNITKCGRTKCVSQRTQALQTACVDNINILHEYPTSNDILLESIIHDIFKKYRSNSNREHFYCNVNYMKLIINIAGSVLDTLKSTYEHITKEELLEKIYENINNKINELNNNSDSSNNINDLNNNTNNINRIIKEIRCEYCSKIFSSRQSKSEHKRKACKIIL